MWIAPKSLFVDADPVSGVGRQHRWCRIGLALRVHRSLDEAGHAIKGPPGTWETLPSPSYKAPVLGTGRPKPWPFRGSTRHGRERRKECGPVPAGEETSSPGRAVGSRSVS